MECRVERWTGYHFVDWRAEVSVCSDAETEPPGAPAQLGGEGRKAVALWERDLKSGGKKGGGMRRARLGAGLEEGGGGRGRRPKRPSHSP